MDSTATPTGERFAGIGIADEWADIFFRYLLGLGAVVMVFTRSQEGSRKFLFLRSHLNI